MMAKSIKPIRAWASVMKEDLKIEASMVFRSRQEVLDHHKSIDSVLNASDYMAVPVEIRPIKKNRR